MLRSTLFAAVVAVGSLLLGGCTEVKGDPVSVTEAPVPSTADDTGGIPVSAAGVGTVGDGDVVVDVYFDVICPFCGLLDQINGPDLAELIAGGGVTVVYHPVAILDSYSEGTAYSTRAANALAVVADKDPEHFPAFASALLSEGIQPEEGTPGLSDQQIAEVAQGVGVKKAVTDQFTGRIRLDRKVQRTFEPWVRQATGMVPSRDGRVGTPTVVINGERFTESFLDAGVLRNAVEAAKG